MTKLTPQEVQQYHEDGYIVIKSMLSPEQIALLGRRTAFSTSTPTAKPTAKAAPCVCRSGTTLPTPSTA